VIVHVLLGDEFENRLEKIGVEAQVGVDPLEQ